ncbi:MAG: hypothetical protein KU37_07505 [Sulfuricurvum sp. PC08-66]|nr:MAG: hypothetical protein KU37_07505 [Sulfuricurvum sp. PC08-66]
MDIYQPQEGYCFNSDTLFLYSFIARFAPKGSVLEVGSGSGVLGLLLKRDFPIELLQIEKAPEFIPYARQNLHANGIDATLIEGDFLTHAFDKAFDFIVSNPPFYHEGVVQSTHALRNSARYEHHLPLGNFVARASKLLAPRGRLLFCYDAVDAPRVMGLLWEATLTVEYLQFVHPTPDKNASLVMVCARKSSKAKCHTLPPIIAVQGGAHTPQAQAIYTQTATKSIKCQLPS